MRISDWSSDVCSSDLKEMAEFVCEREIDSALRPDPVVVDDDPALSARRRPKQGAVEARQVVAAHADDRLIRESLCRVFPRDGRNVDGEPIRAEDRSQAVRDLERPANARARTINWSALTTWT